MSVPAADVLLRLRYAAEHPDSYTPEELAALLVEAAEAIETLRLLVGIRKEIEIEDAEPEGHA
jgi:hypothetical protein